MNTGFRKVAVSVGLAAILVTAVAYFIKFRETVPDSYAVLCQNSTETWMSSIGRRLRASENGAATHATE